MANGNNSFDWRAVSVFFTVVLALFAINAYLNVDKIDSAVNKHAVETERRNSESISDIKQDLARVNARQEVLLESVDELKEQNKKILERLR